MEINKKLKFNDMHKTKSTLDKEITCMEMCNPEKPADITKSLG